MSRIWVRDPALANRRGDQEPGDVVQIEAVGFEGRQGLEREIRKGAFVSIGSVPGILDAPAERFVLHGRILRYARAPDCRLRHRAVTVTDTEEALADIVEAIRYLNDRNPTAR